MKKIITAIILSLFAFNSFAATKKAVKPAKKVVKTHKKVANAVKIPTKK